MAEIKNLEEIIQTIVPLRTSGSQIVLANGAFDLFHVGHLRYLKGAKAEGDILVVAINSDSSVRAAKGSERPIVPQDERAEIISALSCVDFILIFSDLNVERIIRELRPDIHAKGTDYTADSVPEAEIVRSVGGRVAIVGDPKDHSTTETLAKLGELEKGEA